ncbi:MAG TPA: NAD+ synthase [Acidimicrobiia bacterium]|nr:NAD+ synthase [Acidimicrobiia bacterium]
MPRLRVAAAQINATVGDLAGNVERILAAIDAAEAAGADLVALPELAITGYPPEDLLLRPAFVAEAQKALEKVAARTGQTVAVIGFPLAGRDLYNAAAVCAGGAVRGVYRKWLLPNYGVFDEARYFTPSDDPGSLFIVGGVRVAVSICEDVWTPTGPIAAQAAGGAELAVNINASPYYEDRISERETMLATRAADHSVPILYVNQVGGQDELVFDGGSAVYDESGHLLARARQFEEDLLVVDLDVRPMFRKRLLDPRGRASRPPLPEIHISDARPVSTPALPARCEPRLSPEAEVWSALCVGTGDYVGKNRFSDVLIGLSGGIDSAVVAAVAADALGPGHVTGVLMPSRYSSDHSVSDSEALAANLGIRTLTIPIEEAHRAFLDILAEPFAGTEPGLAEENLQARIRGTILMSLSNKFNWMVLTTGNKSEMATGYATLYGDMAGGFAVLKDVEKTLVYRLARWRNRDGVVIPQNILEKPPSAELAPGQVDADSLPPYDVLDPILEGYVEGDRSVTELELAGYDPATVRRVAQLVDRSEYKRRQAPPGVRVSPKAFGKDRRLPITNGWTG